MALLTKLFFFTQRFLSLLVGTTATLRMSLRRDCLKMCAPLPAYLKYYLLLNVASFNPRPFAEKRMAETSNDQRLISLDSGIMWSRATVKLNSSF